jgi:hypothetical protein
MQESRPHAIRFLRRPFLRNPFREAQSRVASNNAVAVALCDQYPIVTDREHLPAADQRIDVRVALCVEAEFDECHVLILRHGVSEQRAHARPGAVRANDHVKAFGRAAGEHVVAAIRARCNGVDLAPPPHHSRHQRIQQNPAQSSPIDLGSIVAGSVSVSNVPFRS